MRNPELIFVNGRNPHAGPKILHFRGDPVVLDTVFWVKHNVIKLESIIYAVRAKRGERDLLSERSEVAQRDLELTTNHISASASCLRLPLPCTAGSSRENIKWIIIFPVTKSGDALTMLGNLQKKYLHSEHILMTKKYVYVPRSRGVDIVFLFFFVVFLRKSKEQKVKYIWIFFEDFPPLKYNNNIYKIYYNIIKYKYW